MFYMQIINGISAYNRIIIGTMYLTGKNSPVHIYGVMHCAYFCTPNINCELYSCMW